ncbi:MAG: TonB-dependent receptor [Cyanobacteriota bacterium SKYGB_h_bin112]|nr:TonB-dependent receptor [Cyanobacteriota bacterium SKYGB_h_bin112]
MTTMMISRSLTGVLIAAAATLSVQILPAQAEDAMVNPPGGTIAQASPPAAPTPEAKPTELAPEDEEEITVIDRILKQPVYSPFRREGELREATRPTYVVTREEIAAQGARTVQEALKFLPGIASDGTAGGHLGALSSQFARGASSSQVLILLDGRPINTFDTGAFDLSNFTTDFVEQVEYTSGGGSTLYGSSAIGGVINIITRRPPSQGVTASTQLQVGSYSYNQQAVQSAGRLDATGYVIGYNRTQSFSNFPFEIPRANFSGIRENADVLYENLNLRLEQALGDRNTLDFSVLFLNKDLGNPGGVPIPITGSAGRFNSLTRNDRTLTDQWLTSLTWTSKLGGGNDSLLTARFFADFLDTRVTRPNFDNQFESYQNALGLQVQHSWRFTPSQTITYGADYRNTNVNNRDLVISTNSRTDQYNKGLSQGAIFALYDVKFSPEFSFNVGIRQDFNSLANGSVTSPAAGLRWQVSESTTLRANYARSFRVPTAVDLFFPGFSNPNLRPETANAFDIGVDQTLGNFGLLRFTAFYNEVSDAIVFVFNPATFAGAPENVRRVRTLGFEAAANVQVAENWYLFANYTLNNSRILDDPNALLIGNRLAFTDADSFNVGLSYETPQGFYAGVLLHLLGQRFTNLTNTESLPSYTTVDLKLRVPIDRTLVINASLNNVFDQRYEVFPGFPGIGINFRAGLNWSF